jgi:excisionase family DNA binding protein
MPDPEFWTSQEVCDFLGIPLSTLRYWQWQRTGPRSYRMGRHRKYKPADVRAWAERQAEEPAEKAADA